MDPLSITTPSASAPSGSSRVQDTFATADLNTTSVFILHHLVDRPFRESLSKHLAMAKRTGSLRTRTADNVGPGQMRQDAMRSALLASEIVVVLVSADLLASKEEFKLMQDAVGHAYKTGAHLVPILVRECLLDHVPFSRMQMLPRDLRAIGALREHEQEVAWAQIAKELWALAAPELAASGASSAAVSPSPRSAAPHSSHSSRAPVSHPASSAPVSHPASSAPVSHPASGAPVSHRDSLSSWSGDRPTLQSPVWPTGQGAPPAASPAFPARRLWIAGGAVAAVLGLALAGAGLAILVDKSSGPRTTATPQPKGTSTQPAPPQSAPASQPTSTAPAETAGGPVSPADVRSSSFADLGRPEGAFDRDERTAWCEGAAGSPTGQWVHATAPAGTVFTGIELTGGWNYDSPRARANRPDKLGDMWVLASTARRLRVDWQGGTDTVEFTSADRGVRKPVKLTGGSTWVRVTIEASIRSSVSKTVCLDDFTLLGRRAP